MRLERRPPAVLPLWWYRANIVLTTAMLIVSALAVGAPDPWFSLRARLASFLVFMAAGGWQLVVSRRLFVERPPIDYLKTRERSIWLGVVLASPFCVLYGMAAFVYTTAAID